MSVLASQGELELAQDGARASRTAGTIVSEGVAAGMIAATAVAVVFLLVDVVAGAALRTPTQLGGMLLSAFGAAADPSDAATPMAVYTLFHFIAFIGAGVLASSIVQMTMKQPITVLLFVILFFAFEVAFTGFVAYLDATGTLGVTPLQVALGNVTASIAMAVFFRARNPRLAHLGDVLDRDG